MLLGIVGLNGSGKDTVAKYLIDNYNFSHEDFGQEIRDELKVLGKNHLDRNEMVLLANERRTKFGFNYWAKRLLAKHSPTENLVITSIRNPAEIDEIKSSGGVIVEVFAELPTRYARTVERVKKDSSAHGDVASFEEFKLKEERELTSTDPAKQQLLKCISSAQYKINNNGSVNELGKQVEDLLEKIKGKKK
ncbi:MAG: AAA family ATPase [archaeon]